MTHEYLVIFQYHEPEPRQLFERGLIEDYESSTGVFIKAESAAAGDAVTKIVRSGLTGG